MRPSYWGPNHTDEQHRYPSNPYGHVHPQHHAYPAQGTPYYTPPDPSTGTGEPAAHPLRRHYSVPDIQPPLVHAYQNHPPYPSYPIPPQPETQGVYFSHPASSAYMANHNAFSYQQGGVTRDQYQRPSAPQQYQPPTVQQYQPPSQPQPSAPLYRHAPPHDSSAPQAPVPPHPTPAAFQTAFATQSQMPPPNPVPPSQSFDVHSQAPPSRAVPLTSQQSYTFIAESPGTYTTKPARKAPVRRKSTVTATPATGPTESRSGSQTETQVAPDPQPEIVPKNSSQAEDRYSVPRGSTVETLLASGFVPPLTAIGDNLTHDEGRRIFQALPAVDRKAILAAFLAVQDAMDVDLEDYPIFTMGSQSPPTGPSYKSTSSTVTPDGVHAAGTSSMTRPRARFRTTVEDASDSDDPSSARIPASAKRKQRAPGFTQYCFQVDDDEDSISPPTQLYHTPPHATDATAHNTPINVRVLDAVQSVKESVDRRLDNIEDTIDTLNIKIESAIQSPGRRTSYSTPPRRKSRARSVAARIAQANGEDFSEQLAAVTSDDEMEATTPQRTREKASRASATPTAIDPEEEKGHLMRLATCIRKHFDHDFLHIRTVKDLPVLVPALTEDEAKQYTETPGPIITSRANFKIDLSRGWRTFRLNQEAADIFITDFLNVMAGGAYPTHPPIPARYMKRSFVDTALQGHVDYLKTEFNKLTKKETPRVKQQQQDEIMRRRATTRQRNTLEGRREVVSDPAFGLERHAVLLNKLMPVHVSPDEPAVPGVGMDCRTYHIIEALWQSRPYKTFMRGIDGLRNAKRAREDKGGNRPRQRLELREPKTVNSKAPKGLWRNCYDADWLTHLKTLTPHLYNALEVIEEDYDFSLDPRPLPPPPQQPATPRAPPRHR